MRWLWIGCLLWGCAKMGDSAAAPEEMEDRFIEVKLKPGAVAGSTQADQEAGEAESPVDPAALPRIVADLDLADDDAPEPEPVLDEEGDRFTIVTAPPPAQVVNGAVLGGDEGKLGAVDNPPAVLGAKGYRDETVRLDEGERKRVVALAKEDLAGKDEKKEAEKRDANKPEDDSRGSFRAKIDVTEQRNVRGEPPTSRLQSELDGQLGDGWLARGDLDVKPARFLPRLFYFENTYLGRSAAFLERLRRLDAAFAGHHKPYTYASLPPQAVDAPEDAGMRLDVSVDRRWVDGPGRVFLQVALQGSRRFGWRRPPLDMAVVVDGSAAHGQPALVMKALTHLLRTLGPQDRLGVFLAGQPPTMLADVADLRATRKALERLQGAADIRPGGLPAALALAGERLRIASQGEARVPGSQSVLILTDGGAPGHAAQAAHRLTVQGAVTSVVDLSGDWGWWAVANAGHGNLHRVEGSVAVAVDAELERASQVIARLLRVNVRLAPNVEAVRVLGSRVLREEEVKRVKAREEATDRQLSKTLGVKSDRGEDDDGIQTVIPFFYGGDAHVILVELWVDQPGPVADVTLRYKDMVGLKNATARASAAVAGVPEPTTDAELAVRRNVRGFELAEALDAAGDLLARGRAHDALARLDAARPATRADAALLREFRRLLRGGTPPAMARAALEYASRRRISHAAMR